jgi:hypothetical protein
MLHKPISHARELLLCYTSKKITSKIHKLTNYKSNYTNTIYMKVNTSLCMGIANQRKDDDTVIFIPSFTCLLTH